MCINAKADARTRVPACYTSQIENACSRCGCAHVPYAQTARPKIRTCGPGLRDAGSKGKRDEEEEARKDRGKKEANKGEEGRRQESEDSLKDGGD